MLFKVNIPTFQGGDDAVSGLNIKSEAENMEAMVADIVEETKTN